MNDNFKTELFEDSILSLNPFYTNIVEQFKSWRVQYFKETLNTTKMSTV